LFAAKNFLLPRVDAIASMRTEGLGDDLLGGSGSFQSTLNEMYSFQHYDFSAGLQVSVPLGYRREMAGVRHAELNLCRERALLREQEKAVAHEVGEAIADVVTSHQNIRLSYDRLLAAEQVVAARLALFGAGKVAIDSLLEAQRRLAQARTDYFRARVGHAAAIKAVHLSKGTLLPYNGIELSEGPSCMNAVSQARKRIRREHRLIDYRMTKPCNISLGQVENDIDWSCQASRKVVHPVVSVPRVAPACKVPGASLAEPQPSAVLLHDFLSPEMPPIENLLEAAPPQPLRAEVAPLGLEPREAAGLQSTEVFDAEP